MYVFFHIYMSEIVRLLTIPDENSRELFLYELDWFCRKKLIDFDTLYQENHFFGNSTSDASSIPRRDINTTIIEKVCDDVCGEFYESFFVYIIHHFIDFLSRCLRRVYCYTSFKCLHPYIEMTCNFWCKGLTICLSSFYMCNMWYFNGS